MDGTGAALKACTMTVRVSVALRPKESVARTATVGVPAGRCAVATRPVASSNAPSPSRSQAYESRWPRLLAVITIGLPAWGDGTDVVIDTYGIGAEHRSVGRSTWLAQFARALAGTPSSRSEQTVKKPAADFISGAPYPRTRRRTIGHPSRATCGGAARDALNG